MLPHTRLAILLALICVTMFGSLFTPASSQANQPIQPLPTAVATPLAYPGPATTTPLPPSPEPMPAPDLSQEAKLALEFVSQQENLPPEILVVAQEFPYSDSVMKTSYQAVTIIEQLYGQIFKVLVDKQTSVVAYREAVDSERQKVYAAIYGKLQPALYERMQHLKDTDVITVAIVAASAPGQSIAEQTEAANQTLAAKYPEARAAVQAGSKPMDIADPTLAKNIEAEYQALIQDSVMQQIKPLEAALTAEGFRVSKGTMAPLLWVTATKKSIEQLAQRADIGTLFLGESGPGVPTLDTAQKTNRAPAVWRRGYDGTGTGSGVKIAIVDDTNVDFTSNSSNCPASSNNCFRRPGLSRLAMNGLTGDHATITASAAASDHASLKGTAPGAQIMSAGLQADTSDLSAAYAVEWAINNGASIINTSYAWCYYPSSYDTVNPLDFYYDNLARRYLRLFTVAAGNSTSCDDLTSNNYVTTPGKAWNVLTVGAYNDQGNPDWLFDGMWSGSNYGNPASPHGDHEKPEVVAPGQGLKGVSNDGVITDDRTGTSFAAPQVAGLAALLIHRNSYLDYWPEATRAIIMASADHDLEPAGIYDSKEGAGGINADLADSTAGTRGATASSPSNACSGPCWWGEGLTSASFDANGYRYYYFKGTAGDRVRFAMSWWSNPSCPTNWFSCSSDQLSTDLDMVIYKPDGTQMGGVWSSSWDNNYELIARDGVVVLPETGTYRIGVYRKSFNETSNFLGVAWTRLPAKVGTYDGSHPAVGYTGYWETPIAPITLARAANATLTYSNSGGATARFSFNGSRISYRHTMTYNRGGYRVYLDGELLGSYNAYTPETRWQAVKTWFMSSTSGDHTIEVVADGGSYVDIDSFVVDTPYVGGSIDDSQTSYVQYIGNYGEWSAISSFPSAFNSTLRWTKVAENEAGTTFSGSQVTYVYTKAANRGKATITIDGTNYGYVDLYSPLTRWQQSTTFYLSPGYHTIHVGVSGQKNGSSSDYYIDLDRFIFQ